MYSYLGVGRVDNFVDISPLDPEEGNNTPTSEKGNEEEKANDVCAGSFLLYRIISIITIGFSISLVSVPLKLYFETHIIFSPLQASPLSHNLCADLCRRYLHTEGPSEQERDHPHRGGSCSFHQSCPSSAW